MEMDLPDLQINLADPKSIREQLPQVEAVVEEKRREAADAQQVFETWEAIQRKLKTLAGLVLHIDGAGASTAAQDAVVRIVEEEGRPIRPIGVEKVLKAEGHDVDGLDAVNAVLAAAAVAGRLQQLEPRGYAPNSIDLDLFQEAPVMQAVPEAHLGLDGPPPRSKAEAAIRVLASEPDRKWTTPDVGQAMIDLGWMADSSSDFASLASTLSRLVAERKIFRPVRGQYQLAPPHDEAGGELGS